MSNALKKDVGKFDLLVINSEILMVILRMHSNITVIADEAAAKLIN
ncbi:MULTISPECIES: hypothetical protein [Enterococcus]|nr:MULTISPECIES: hypothetical protein [Enterococcus]MCG4865743.1 hypothetical protein [Enterococcus avium]MCQ4673782.1 hypothetical protein [Enterococcus avium]MDB1722876.1 hypothetical protein [Enterococcus avium]MDB1726564.1 hypothetical protein [Enterococcus avium]MDB1732341.1 hypothetical protein [Enterococcus avium]